MASYNRKVKRGPVNIRTTDGNLARKLDRQELERQLERSGRMDFDQLYERRPEPFAERNARRRAQLKAAQRPAQHVSPLALLGSVCVALLVVVLLLCYVRLNTISRNIVAMKNEIHQLEIQQVSLVTQYEQTFDLSAVKDAAIASGMIQPNESQVFYINLPGEDQARVYHNDAGSIERFLDSLKELAARALS